MAAESPWGGPQTEVCVCALSRAHTQSSHAARETSAPVAPSLCVSSSSPAPIPIPVHALTRSSPCRTLLACPPRSSCVCTHRPKRCVCLERRGRQQMFTLFQLRTWFLAPHQALHFCSRSKALRGGQRWLLPFELPQEQGRGGGLGSAGGRPGRESEDLEQRGQGIHSVYFQSSPDNRPRERERERENAFDLASQGRAGP